MRLKLTFLLYLSSFLVSAQFFVTDLIPLSLKSSETLLNSQETHAQITGKGTLYFNSTSQQQLASSQTLLELPSLLAHLVKIQTVLHIQYLEIENGQLQLNYPLLLPNPRILKLRATAAANKSKHHLLCTTQLKASQPLALQNPQRSIFWTSSISKISTNAPYSYIEKRVQEKDAKLKHVHKIYHRTPIINT